MGAPIGNLNAEKFSTPEERQKVASDYLEHCRLGLSDASFYVEEDTMRRYIDDYPIDFGTIKEARRLRRLFWENMGIKGMSGEIKGFNSASWIFNMKNRFGWKDQNPISQDEFPDGKMDLVTYFKQIH